MADLLDPVDKLARIAAVGPYPPAEVLRRAGQQQAGETPRQSAQNKLGSVAVLDRGRMHHHGPVCVRTRTGRNDQADGVDDMPFAAVDFRFFRAGGVGAGLKPAHIWWVS
jgi:hypothetical protein